MDKWRKSYDNKNEWEKIQIAGKVGQFFTQFRQTALSRVNTDYNPGNQDMNWFEQFGWTETTIQLQLTKINLKFEDLCMYIEKELEYENVYLSAREDRYKNRQERLEKL